MAIIRELKGDMPIIGDGTFLAETATIIGTVEMGCDCSIWYGAVLRGDLHVRCLQRGADVRYYGAAMS